MQIAFRHSAHHPSAAAPVPVGDEPMIPTVAAPPDPSGSRPLGADSGMSRRTLFGLTTLAAAGTLGTQWLAWPEQARAATAPPTTVPAGPVGPGGRPQNRALAFLTTAEDAYPGANPGVRLAQSYADELGLFSTAFVYDNALAICAYLASGLRYLTHARQLGDALLYAQDHDPDHVDGRLRQAYNVGPYVFYDGNPQEYGFVLPDGTANIGWQFGFTRTAVGDMAWVGIALVQLFAHTRERRYLSGALRIARWIVTTARSDQPLGGFRFGVDGADEPVTVSSTEHNIDAAAFFALLARAGRDRSWLRHSRHARAFVARMWDSDGGFFYTGSNDGTTVNTSPVPEDTQTWSWLALRDRRYVRSIDWARARLATTDTPTAANSQLPDGVRISGMTFSSASLTSTAEYNGRTVNRSGVWLEGTGHLAAALADRSCYEDRWAAEDALRQIELAQDELGAGQHLGGAPLAPRSGVVAASSLIDTGFGYGYFPVRHVGATAWYLLAAHSANPYRRKGLGR